MGVPGHAAFAGLNAGSGEINLEVQDKPAAIERVKKHFASAGGEIDEFDGVTVGFPDAWLNIRASNTEPLLRVNVEGETKNDMEALRDDVLAVLQSPAE